MSLRDGNEVSCAQDFADSCGLQDVGLWATPPALHLPVHCRATCHDDDEL